MRIPLYLLLVLATVFLNAPVTLAAEGRQAIPAPPGKVTLLDLGSLSCIPCKMMEPILAKLKKEYQDQAEIVFIDISKEREQARQYDIQVIPTQIFYTRQGEEIYRHQGFLDEAAARKMLDILLEE